MAIARVIVLLACGVACRGPHAPSEAASEPVPGPPPVAADELLAARDRGDVAVARAHAWHVWAAINQPANGRLVWETWPRSDQVLGRPDRRLRKPAAFRDGATLVTEPLPIMFTVAFDPIAAGFVRARGVGTRAELRRLRAAHQAIPEFPRGAIAIKAEWYPIAAHGLTAMPIWDGDPVEADAHGNAARTWRRVIAVDPSRDAVPPGETADVILAGGHAIAHVVPLAAFVHHVMSAAELVAARLATGVGSLEAGDSIALVGMHLTTKEIPDWVWATFWWHDRADDGGFAAGRTDDVRGVARAYLMDVTLDTGAPCMNPWLEARFPGGLRSNCVTCHQRAVFGVDDYLPVTHGRLAADDPYFVDRVPTDFLWSLALEAR